MAENRLIISSSLIIGAVLLDLLIGDPRFLPHPVEIMGHLIRFLQNKINSYSIKNKLGLRISGFIICFIVIASCGLTGWLIEKLFLSTKEVLTHYLISLLLVVSLASCLATKSLIISVLDITNSIPNNFNNNLDNVRNKLKNIVGRNVENLNKEEILRATAESASENSVDGIFAPLFWMMVGAYLWELSSLLPGPLTMALIFKASSTIDSMIGYKEGNLEWLGECGAKIDDILVFIPCRLVVISLPFVSNHWSKSINLIKKSFEEGSKDMSPNSGLSEAIFANCAQVRMGGLNKYKQTFKNKSILAPNAPKATIAKIKKILKLSIKLEIIWVLAFTLLITFST